MVRARESLIHHTMYVSVRYTGALLALHRISVITCAAAHILRKWPSGRPPAVVLSRLRETATALWWLYTTTAC